MGNKIVSTNAIRGAIESNYCVEIFATEKSKQNNLITLAEKKGIKINLVTKEKLDSIFGHNHQGICAYAKPVYTVGLEEIVHDAKKKENPIVVMLDELTDPHNLGAILRTCDAFNISGVVYKKRGNVSLNETVVKMLADSDTFVPQENAHTATSQIAAMIQSTDDDDKFMKYLSNTIEIVIQ